MNDCQLHKAPHGEVLRLTLALVGEPGAVYELRIPQTTEGTVSGYFNDRAKLVEAALAWNGLAPGIYITLNPVRPNLLARAPNCLRSRVRHGATTSDADILRRRWLFLDFDPVRPAGVSAKAKEKETAWERCWDCTTWLPAQIGLPPETVADKKAAPELAQRLLQLGTAPQQRASR